MPSHTFTRTGYWQESIQSNIAAAAAAKQQSQTAEELHASDYEIYAYLQSGQDAAARQLLASLPEIASRFDPKVVIGGAASPSVGYFALAAIPARFALEHQEWKQATELTPHESGHGFVSLRRTRSLERFRQEAQLGAPAKERCAQQRRQAQRRSDQPAAVQDISRRAGRCAKQFSRKAELGDERFQFSQVWKVIFLLP